MNKKGLLIVLVLFPLLTCSAGCVVVNKAISASAVANNLAVEKAQNEMLLLNVLRGKDHQPMYVTGIAKINGQVKAEAGLGVTVPFGDIGAGHAEASQYVASPSATYNWNPNFDVIVFDTSEFMRGFLTPVNSDIFGYYWGLGFYPKVLFGLMVLKVQVAVTPVCVAKKDAEVEVKEYIFKNNHERGDTNPVELEQFSYWVSNFLENKPYFLEGKNEPLGPPLTPEQAQRALIKGLREGFTLVPAGKQFQFQRLEKAPTILKLNKDVFQDIYNETLTIANQEGSKTEIFSREGPCSTAAEADAAAEPEAAAGTLRQSGHVKIKVEKEVGKEVEAEMTITLFLRSPEAILYYLGELARLEEEKKKAVYLCIGERFEPLFVVRRSGDCRNSSVAVTYRDGKSYAIPADKIEEPCKGRKYEFRDFSCDPGRSMEALTIVSQIIALQKSAKDLPTTSVVRVVGQ